MVTIVNSFQLKLACQLANTRHQCFGTKVKNAASFPSLQPQVGHRVSIRQKSSPRCLFQYPFRYTSELHEVNPHQLQKLWERTLPEGPRDVQKIMKAIRHSYAFILVKDDSKDGKIIGAGRAISDGQFIATILDVAVDPDYQRKGIGRKIVRKLVEDMKGRGPSGFAVFPPPISRRFFWMIGFRADKEYRIMLYKKNDGQIEGFPLDSHVRESQCPDDTIVA